jgi:hypothetical protein
MCALQHNGAPTVPVELLAAAMEYQACSAFFAPTDRRWNCLEYAPHILSQAMHLKWRHPVAERGAQP